MRDGSCLRLKEGGPVLGIFPGRRYLQEEVELHAGDALVLFTDGVTEARNASGVEFGEDRLRDLLALGHKLRANELRDVIMSAVSEFTAGNVQDDATLMVLTAD